MITAGNRNNYVKEDFIMGMTMTQKILAAHAGLPSVSAGQLIEAELDLVLGNDITSPVAIHEDGFLCAGGRKLLFARSSSKKENGFVTTTDYYRCNDCSGCELRSKCFKSSDEVKNKEIRMCVESTEHRKTAFENLLSERGALLRMNRSIQVEGAFGVLKSNRSFRRFLMRGKTNISTELFLLCLAFDPQKFFSKLQRGKRKSHLFPLKKE